MKRFALFLMLMIGSFFGMAQKTTANITKNWSTAGLPPTGPWTDGVAPPFTNIPSTNVNYFINGTIGVGTFGTTTTTMSFSNSNDNLNFTVNGTLVVFGDMTFGNKAMNLIIPSGGLVIVMGNLTSDNQITLTNGGTLVVKGTTTFNGGNGQNNYTGTGKFWPIGGLAGGFVDPDATAAAAASGSFAANASQYIQNIVNGSVNPLPVELISFTGNANNGKVNLSWTTASELNFDYFEVERADNPKEFKGIGKVTGHGTSSIRHDYSLTDEMPLVGKNYYRLKSVDVDGHFEYSKLVAVDFSADKVFSIYPNPSDGSSLNFSLNFVPGVNSSIIVLDNIGNVVGMYKPSDYSQGISFTNQLKGGVYYAKIFSDDFVKVERFVVR